MPLPTTLADLSTTAASNFPAGSDSPASLDDVQRAHAAFIAQLRDGSHVPSATAKTTAVDADLFPINDSAASNILKKLTFANLKASLKTYFDTLYGAIGAYAASGANSDITSLSALTSINILPGYLFGCTLSTAGSSATMSISAGRATDSTGLQSMALTAISKTTSAWAVGAGNGGIDSGAIANNTWYHFYVIRRPDTGVVDVVFSTNATSPTLPTNYTQFRRIGSGRTNGSGQWISFTQFGDAFYWAATILDVNAGTAATSATLNTLTVPLGVQTTAVFNAMLNGASSNVQTYISSPSQNDEAPSITVAPLFSVASYNIGSLVFAQQMQVLTNTSSQIRRRETVSAGTVSISTIGWIDSRGRNA